MSAVWGSGASIPIHNINKKILNMQRQEHPKDNISSMDTEMHGESLELTKAACDDIMETITTRIETSSHRLPRWSGARPAGALGGTDHRSPFRYVGRQDSATHALRTGSKNRRGGRVPQRMQSVSGSWAVVVYHGWDRKDYSFIPQRIRSGDVHQQSD